MSNVCFSFVTQWVDLCNLLTLKAFISLDYCFYDAVVSTKPHEPSPAGTLYDYPAIPITQTQDLPAGILSMCHCYNYTNLNVPSF